MSHDEVRLIPATTHGRVLIRAASRPAGILAGFHGYMENAAVQMARLAAIPGAEAWTLISIQALHRFYRGRTQEVVASWMTSEDRDAMIDDNIQYVNAALDTQAPAPDMPIVCVGFSQGVPMAFRAAVRGRFRAAGIIAVGGEIPPELITDPSVPFPSVLLARGERDDWYSSAKMEAEVGILTTRGAAVQPLVFDGAHEWTAEVSIAAGAFLHNLAPGLAP
jgi:predicted esterase